MQSAVGHQKLVKEPKLHEGGVVGIYLELHISRLRVFFVFFMFVVLACISNEPGAYVLPLLVHIYKSMAICNDSACQGLFEDPFHVA